jgi:hypothetical protein
MNGSIRRIPEISVRNSYPTGMPGMEIHHWMIQTIPSNIRLARCRMGKQLWTLPSILPPGVVNIIGSQCILSLRTMLGGSMIGSTGIIKKGALRGR